MAQEPLKQEGVPEPDGKQTVDEGRQQFISKPQGDQILTLYDKATEAEKRAALLLKRVKRTSRRIGWIETVTYLGFALITISFLGILLDVFFHFTEPSQKEPIIIYPSTANVYQPEQ